MSADPTDVELLQSWQRGDLLAGERLVERHFASLYRFFHRSVDDGVSDLVQRTWTACVAKLGSIPDEPGFKAFMFGVAHKELAMHLRKRLRAERAMVRLARERADATSPSQVVSAREQRKVLRWAMRQLPLAARTLLDLYYWEGLGIDAIAGVLEVAPGTVKSRLHRARARLSEVMGSARAASVDIETIRERSDGTVALVRQLGST